MATSQRHTEQSVAADLTTPPAVRMDPAATIDPAQTVSVGAGRVAAALAGPDAARGRNEWLTVVGDCQSLINMLTAVQDTAIAEAARRESVWCEDGTLGETVYAPGQVTLDAADVVAPVIGATHQQAQRRVEQAVRLASRRVPVPAEARDLPEASGLGGLHQAMAAGHLDSYRVSVIAFELEVAPAHVADAVVAALSGHFGDDSTALRRRTRVLLSRISPDLVRERTKRARANTGLRRWVAEPGVDEWHGTFPSEDAATAWAAIDRLAHDLVTAGTCTNIEQARGKALTDLVTGNATIDVQILLTVPADTQMAPEPPATTVGADVPASGDHPAASMAGAVAVSAVPTTDEVALNASELSSGHLFQGPAIAPEPSIIGAAGPSTPAERADALAAITTTTQRTFADGPTGQPASAECTDAPVEVHTASGSASATGDGDAAAVPPTHPPTAPEPGLDLTNAPPALPPPAQVQPTLACTTGSDDDLVEVQGSRPSEPLLVRRGWLRDHLRKRPPQPKRRRPKVAPVFVPCDPLTGARLDPRGTLNTDAYRPSAELTALVKARDGRCRFPGCSVAARFCDLDHVRPWPLGRTAARNLLTLCRRHHRIKQRPGWQLRLAPDGTATWTDPTGRTRTTTPLDALRALVLAADRADTVPMVTLTEPRPKGLPVSQVRETVTAATATANQLPPAEPVANGAWSALETHLEFTLEHHPHEHPDQRGWLPATHRRCTSAATLRAGVPRGRARAFPDTPPF